MARVVEFLGSVIGQILLILCTVVTVVVAAHQVFFVTTGMQNVIRIQEMNAQTLLRAERAADYAIITLSDLIISYRGSCDVAEHEQLSMALYSRGVVKDLRILNTDGVVECSAIAQNPDMQFSQLELETGIAGSAENIKFHRMGDGKSGHLGISWAASPGRIFLAVISVDTLMFDVFPQALRLAATARLMLGDETIAQYVPENNSDTGKDWQVFDASSDRFPFSTQLKVDPQVLATWNKVAEPYVLMVAVVMGLFVGYLLSLAVSRRDTVVAAIREGLRRKEFVGHVQPIFMLNDRRMVGGEALARWVKSDGSVVPPSRFINTAEDCGLIVPITWQIFDSVLSQTAGFLQRNSAFRIGFNITPDHLISDGFVEDICARVKMHGVKNQNVIIELTERQEIVDIEAASKRIKDLRVLGFGISLDDTGTGHNGLSNVQRLGIETIKIDKHFVDLIGVDEVASKIIDMLVHLAKDLNMNTVAEGIETEAQLTALRACGVERGQGFLVSRAVPANELESLVLQTRVLQSPSRVA